MTSFLRLHSDGSSIYKLWSGTASSSNCLWLEGEKCWAAVRKSVHPCWLACASDLDEPVDTCYRDQNFDIEMKTGVSLPLLLEVARLGSERVFLQLLERGTDLWFATPRYMKRAIHFAAENGHISVIKLIAERIQVEKRFLKLITDDFGLTSVDQVEVKISKLGIDNAELVERMEDDLAAELAPVTHVDYLAHEWKEHDILSTWRYVDYLHPVPIVEQLAP